ncbi:MAG: hypothetical protein E6G83_13265 [Alphaproteobacteria bacterium]|nr:MAG: hypothetical protein E6G83_13265 [Alphaproteobacteria bacterium]
MAEYKLISADSHIVEPPDMYTGRIEPRFRDRAPKMERRKTPSGREYDAWVLDGMQVGTLGAVMQAGQRFEDPSQIDFLGVWEDVRKGGYDPHAMIKENEEDGVWGSCLQPSQGLFWYRIPDSELLTEICRVYNDWIADFCKPYPERLKGIGMLNVDDVNVGRQELERCKKLGLVGAFIPVSPLPDKPYSHPIYDRLWWTAQDLGLPLLLHIATPRNGVPGNNRLDPALAAADGLHLSRAAGFHQRLEVARRPAAERLLEAQHVRRVHGRRARRANARQDRRRDDAVG